MGAQKFLFFNDAGYQKNQKPEKAWYFSKIVKIVVLTTFTFEAAVKLEHFESVAVKDVTEIKL